MTEYQKEVWAQIRAKYPAHTEPYRLSSNTLMVWVVTPQGVEIPLTISGDRPAETANLHLTI
jgi:hypothetical protein